MPSLTHIMNYDDWNQAISEAFFNENQAQKPVYLHVDDDLLQDIAQQQGVPTESARQDFIEAGLSRVRFRDNKSQPFYKFLQWRLWETQLRNEPTTPPPFVAFLGLCVLAAVDMTADDSLNVTSSNYYVRLNALLERQDRGCPRGFDEVEQAWKRLNQWLRDDLQGKFGLPTANNALYGRHVGYPISQAIMRRTDMEELPGFFQWCGLEPGEESVDSNYLEQQLKIWTARTTCSFSSQLRRVFEQEQQQHIDQITAATLAYYQTWDGSTTTRRGGRMVEIIIQLNRAGRSFELAFHPKAPPDFPEGQYGTAQLRRSEDPDWFEPLEERLVHQWLSGNAIDLQQGNYRVYLGTKQIVPLRHDITSDLGDWISCNRVTLGERHLILCHKTMKNRVEAYLEEHAESDWRMLMSRDPIYADWVCFNNVRITRYTPGEQEELDCLVPTHRADIRLSGGLKLKQSVWLQGGEPELIVSVEKAEPIYVDDEEIATAVPHSTIINLQTLNLSEGTHTIHVGSQQRNFAISRSGNDLLGQQRLQQWGYPFQQVSETHFQPLSLTAEAVPTDEEIPSGKLYIAGTHIIHSPADPPPPRQHVLILPYGARDYIILGRRIGELLQPTLPTFLPEWKAGDYLRGYKQMVPFEPQWLITVSHRNNITLRPIGRPQPALPEAVSEENTEIWLRWAGNYQLKRRLSKKHRLFANVWLQYSQMARGTE